MKRGPLNKPVEYMALTCGLRKNVTNVRRKSGLMIGLSKVIYGRILVAKNQNILWNILPVSYFILKRTSSAYYSTVKSVRTALINGTYTEHYYLTPTIQNQVPWNGWFVFLSWKKSSLSVTKGWWEQQIWRCVIGEPYQHRCVQLIQSAFDQCKNQCENSNKYRWLFWLKTWWYFIHRLFDLHVGIGGLPLVFRPIACEMFKVIC